MQPAADEWQRAQRVWQSKQIDLLSHLRQAAKVSASCVRSARMAMPSSRTRSACTAAALAVLQRQASLRTAPAKVQRLARACSQSLGAHLAVCSQPDPEGKACPGLALERPLASSVGSSHSSSTLAAGCPPCGPSCRQPTSLLLPAMQSPHAVRHRKPAMPKHKAAGLRLLVTAPKTAVRYAHKPVRDC